MIGSVQGGWGYVSLTGDKMSSSAEHDFEGVTESYGCGFSQGSMVEMSVDLDAGTMAFKVDGVDQGLAFSNVVGPVKVAVSLR